jgi:cytochrome oxidase assembly protein ShyY1
VTFEAANCSYQIITPCRTKEDGQTVLVHKIWHVVSLIDIAAIAHYLPPLLGG